jgi:methylglutaconyl-CoA hydratase
MRLINKIVERDLISSQVFEFAAKLVRTVSADSIRLTKGLLNDIKGFSIGEQLEIAAKANAQARGTVDCKMGIAAFINKEKLNW